MHAFFLLGTQLILSKHFGVGCQRNVGHRKTQGWGCKMSRELKEESGWRKGGREKQLWGTEGETLSISSPKGEKEKESKTQESRGLWSGRSTQNAYWLPHSRWNMERSCLLCCALSDLPSFLPQRRNHQAASQGRFPVVVSSPTASQTEHDPVVPPPRSPICLLSAEKLQPKDKLKCLLFFQPHHLLHLAMEVQSFNRWTTREVQPDSKFNQRSEKMKKQRKTVKQDQIIIVQSLSKVKDFLFLLKGQK